MAWAAIGSLDPHCYVTSVTRKTDSLAQSVTAAPLECAPAAGPALADHAVARPGPQIMALSGPHPGSADDHGEASAVEKVSASSVPNLL